jgi:hypothetical protein
MLDKNIPPNVPPSLLAKNPIPVINDLCYKVQLLISFVIFKSTIVQC